MPEIIQCPQCQRQLRVPDEMGGRSVKCPACGETFTAPSVSSPPPPLEGYVPIDAAPPAPPAYVELPDRGDDYDFRRFESYQPHRATTILVLGILSLTVCGLLGPFAWLMGNDDLAQMRAGRMDPAGEGMTQAGRICGIIGTCLLALTFCCVFGSIVSRN